MHAQQPASVPAGPSSPGADGASPLLHARIRAAVRHGVTGQPGWLPFDRYMAMALYEPGLGYYLRGDRQIGIQPGDGSDFVTAPELTPLFARALARQVAQALDAVQAAGGECIVWEFGAGTGVLARDLLDALGPAVARYAIVDLSGSLRARQAATLAAHANRVQWLTAWPEAIDGVVIGNEVLDAMPVRLACGDGQRWLERGVVWDEQADAPCWAARDTGLAPPPDTLPPLPGAVTEVHEQAQAFVRSLAQRLRRGAAFFLDYGFPESEYYHPQRLGGTLMCHHGHRSDPDPLRDIGCKDITAHVDFTAIALAGQDAGLDVLGYTSQARFLMNCALLQDLAGADPRTLAAAQKLLNEHEMGELFKVLGFARGIALPQPLGFLHGDRTHTL